MHKGHVFGFSKERMWLGFEWLNVRISKLGFSKTPFYMCLLAQACLHMFVRAYL
jgi:hypothetical protein